MSKSIFAMALILLTLAACIQAPPLDEAQTAFCQELRTYGQAVMAIRDLPDTATVDDYKAAQKEAEDGWKELEDSSWELAQAQREAMEPAYNEFRDTLDAVEDETSLADARTAISSGVSSLVTAYDQVSNTQCANVPQ